MRSSDGTYVDRLDHLRALAVFMVFFWHFVHGSADHRLLPIAFVPPAIAFPTSIFEEGHAGVSLFMVLSGYLFTRLIGSRDIRYGAFLRNRALRLLPMLSLVLIPEILRGRETITSLLAGFVHGGWSADGTWSIMVEIQFYVLLPLMLAAARRRPLATLTGIVALAIGLRAGLWASGHEIRDLATYSLVGRIDNFVVGMALATFEARSNPAVRDPRVAAVVFCLFVGTYYLFDAAGGMTLPANSSVWIGLPTLESVGFAALIHLYCGMRFRLPRPAAAALAKIGAASYSIYLLHFFVITVCLAALSPWHLQAWGFVGLSLLSFPVFAVCFAIGWLTYSFIETPFLRLRVPYLRAQRDDGIAAAHVSPRNVQSRLAA